MTDSKLPGDNELPTASELPSDNELIAFVIKAETPPKIREIARFFGLPPAKRSLLRRKLVELADAGHLNQQTGAAPSSSGPSSSGPSSSGVKLVKITAIDHDGYATARLLDDTTSGDTSGDIHLAPPRRSSRSKSRDNRAGNNRTGNNRIRIGDHVLARVQTDAEGRLSGDVMRILPKAQNRLGDGPLLGRVFRQRGAQSGAKRGEWMLESAEKGASRTFPLHVGTDDAPEENLLVEAEMLPRQARAKPTAKIRRIIGPANSPAALAQLSVIEFDLPQDFTDALLRDAAGAKVPPLGSRTDLRDTPLITIDGSDAKDFDDAVFAEPVKGKDAQNKSEWRLIIAIADVSAYVIADSEMDTQARTRGNSVYLPGTVIPMLPEALSNGVCSLVPDEPRACLAVEVYIDGEGKKLRHKFFRGLMKSAARLTYEAVQQVIEGQKDEADIGAPIGAIHHLSGAFHCLKAARDARGTLNLNLPERRVELDADGQISNIVLREQLPAHQLIEEFMILANVCAAETLEAARAVCVYRNHDRPDPAKLNALHEITSALSLPFAKGQVIGPHALNKLLDAVAGKDEEQMLNETILRCQARANYDTDNLGHYGLSLVRYAHFTSPIRRYADLIVHRSLVQTCALGPEILGNTSIDALKQTCAHISQTEQTASKAERRAMDRLSALRYQGAEGQVFDVRIAGVNIAGLFVRIDNGLAEGFIPRRSLPDDRYEITTGGMVLEGQHTGWKFSLGEHLQARLVSVSAASGGLLLSWQGGGTQDSKDQKRKKPKKSKANLEKSRKKTKPKGKKR